MNKKSIQKYILTRDVFARKYLVPYLMRDGQVLELQYLPKIWGSALGPDAVIWRLDQRSVPAYLKRSIEDNLEGLLDEEG